MWAWIGLPPAVRFSSWHSVRPVRVHDVGHVPRGPLRWRCTATRATAELDDRWPRQPASMVPLLAGGVQSGGGAAGGLEPRTRSDLLHVDSSRQRAFASAAANLWHRLTA